MPPRKRQNVETPEPEFDPFGDNQEADEAQTEMPPLWELEDNETDVKNTDTEKKRKVVTVGSGEGKVVVTIKGGRDYDEPWIVFHCEDMDEAVAHVTDYDNLGVLMDAAQKASKKFRDFRPTEDTGTRASAPQNGSQGRTQGKPAQATAHPKGRQEFCQHGEMEFKSGLGKNGKMWGAFDCKVDPKGCARKWDNDFGK